MRSEVKKMLETAENGELIAYITKDQSVAMDELQLWMLRIVAVEGSSATNGDVIKNAVAIHEDGYDTTKLIRSLTEQQLRGLGLKGGHVALIQMYINAAAQRQRSPGKAVSASSGGPDGSAASGAMMSQAMQSMSSAMSDAATKSSSMLADGMLAASRLQARSAAEYIKVYSLPWDAAKPGSTINVASFDIYTEQVRRKHARMSDGTAEAITAVMEGDPAVVPIEDIAAKLDPEADGALYMTIQNTVNREVLHAHGNASAVAEATATILNGGVAGGLGIAASGVKTLHKLRVYASIARPALGQMVAGFIQDSMPSTARTSANFPAEFEAWKTAFREVQYAPMMQDHHAALALTQFLQSTTAMQARIMPVLHGPDGSIHMDDAIKIITDATAVPSNPMFAVQGSYRKPRDQRRGGRGDNDEDWRKPDGGKPEGGKPNRKGDKGGKGDRKGRSDEPCRQFQAGKCTFPNCRFKHVEANKKTYVTRGNDMEALYTEMAALSAENARLREGKRLRMLKAVVADKGVLQASKKKKKAARTTRVPRATTRVKSKYLDQLKNTVSPHTALHDTRARDSTTGHETHAQSLRSIRKGAIVDSAAEEPIAGAADIKYLTNVRALPKAVIFEGISGATVTATEEGDMQYGDIKIIGMKKVPSAKDSVVPTKYITHTAKKNYVETDKCAALVDRDNGETTLLVEEHGGLHRLPMTRPRTRESDLEFLSQCLKNHREHENWKRRIGVEHQIEAHAMTLPGDLCPDKACDRAKMTKAPARRKSTPPSGTERGNLVIQLDFIIADTKDNNKCEVGMTACDNRGYGKFRTQIKRNSAETLATVKEMMAMWRAAYQDESIIVRVHSDGEESIKDGTVAQWLRDQTYVVTTSEPYTSNAAARVENRNRKLQEMARAMLIDAAGTTQTAVELWGEAMRHASEAINYQPEGGARSPWEKAGNAKVNVIDEYYPFGSEVIYHIDAKDPKRVGNKFAERGQQGAVWVGKTVGGLHRIVPIEWNETKREWKLGATIERGSIKVYPSEFPLRTKMADGKKLNSAEWTKFVSTLAPNKVTPIAYRVQSIVGERDTYGAVEYRCKWHGYGLREATWETASHLLNDGCGEVIDDWRRKQERAASTSDRRRLLVTRIGEHVADKHDTDDPDVIAVRHLMRVHKLPRGRETEFLKWYKEELGCVLELAADELHGDERTKALAKEECIPMRMNPEYKPEIDEWKFRWLVRGDMEPAWWKQNTALDAPTARASTSRMLAAVGGSATEELSTGDVKKAFLKGTEYGAGEPQRYTKYRAYKGAPWRVFRLRKSLYGSADAPMRWYQRLKEWLDTKGFKPSEEDCCLFSNATTGARLTTHVDDILLRAEPAVTEKFWHEINKDLGLKGWGYIRPGQPRRHCGSNWSAEDRNGARWYSIDQEADIKEFLMQEGYHGGRHVASPMQNNKEMHSDPTLLVGAEKKKFASLKGSLQWFANQTRWDIAFSVARLGQQGGQPTRGGMNALERVLQYLACHPQHALQCPKVKGTVINVYSDSDHAGDRQETTRSHTGVAIMINGMMTQWVSQKQPDTSVSSAQAEVYALAEAVRLGRATQWVGEDMAMDVQWPLPILVDNAAAISFQQATNLNSKLLGHYRLKDAAIRELRDKKQIKAVKVHTTKNIADIFTKSLMGPVIATLLKEAQTVAEHISDQHRAS